MYLGHRRRHSRTGNKGWKARRSGRARRQIVARNLGLASQGQLRPSLPVLSCRCESKARAYNARFSRKHLQGNEQDYGYWRQQITSAAQRPPRDEKRSKGPPRGGAGRSPDVAARIRSGGGDLFTLHLLQSGLPPRAIIKSSQPSGAVSPTGHLSAPGQI